MWNELHDDLWMAIFDRLRHCHLKNVSLVCKRFLSLSNSTRTYWFIKPKDSIPLPRLYSRFSLIDTINLWDPDPNLHVTVTQIAQSNLPLKFLHISHQTHFPRDAMTLLGRNMSKTLRSLSCTFLTSMEDADLAVVANYFPYLENFDIKFSGCPRFRNSRGKTQQIHTSITDDGILEISTKLRSLVSLNISILDTVTHRSFEYLASNCPSSLRNLSMDFNGYKCNVCLNLFTSLNNLTCLQLEGEKISKGLLVHLVNLKKLEKLSLGYYRRTKDINSAFMCQFLKSLLFLRDLELKSVMFPSDMKAIDFIACIPNIQKIHLSDNPWSNHSIPKATLFHLIKNCPHLENVHICGNLRTCEQDWLSLTVHRCLRQLSLEFCYDLSDEIIMRIASVCKKLGLLYIKESSGISKEGVEAIAARYNNITFIDVTGCHQEENFRIEKNYYSE